VDSTHANFMTNNCTALYALSTARNGTLPINFRRPPRPCLAPGQVHLNANQPHQYSRLTPATFVPVDPDPDRLLAKPR